MFEGTLSAIQGLIEEIYTADQNRLDAKFVVFVNELEKMLEIVSGKGYQADITEDMLEIQSRYEKKDLAELSDYLLYHFKYKILQLQEVLQSEND